MVVLFCRGCAIQVIHWSGSGCGTVSACLQRCHRSVEPDDVAAPERTISAARAVIVLQHAHRKVFLPFGVAMSRWALEVDWPVVAAIFGALTQGLGAVAVAIVGALGLRTWKQQMRGTRSQMFAKDSLSLVYRVQLRARVRGLATAGLGDSHKWIHRIYEEEGLSLRHAGLAVAAVHDGASRSKQPPHLMHCGAWTSSVMRCSMAAASAR